MVALVLLGAALYAPSRGAAAFSVRAMHVKARACDSVYEIFMETRTAPFRRQRRDGSRTIKVREIFTSG